MPGTRPLIAVLHTSAQKYNGVNALAKRLILGYFDKAATFPNGVAKKANFITQAGKLDTLISNAKGNTAIKKQRDAQSPLVFKLIKSALSDTNETADHNVEILTQSGFDLNYQPEAQAEPELANSIKGVVAGKAENTYKIVVTRKSNKPDVEQDPATHQRDVRLDVELTTDTTDPKKTKQVIEYKPTTKLIFNASEVDPTKLNYVRLIAVNTHGRSKPGPWVSFKP
jgi:hypothetical protein